MKTLSHLLTISVLVVLVGILAAVAAMPVAGQSKGSSERLFLSGDIVYFLGRDNPKNCTLNSRFKRGDPVGFRVTALNSVTGLRDRASKLVLHLTYAGQTIDLPMRDRETDQEPNRSFWVTKWIVPKDAQTGIVKYSVTATDPQGRTGEWAPFNVESSSLTIVE